MNNLKVEDFLPYYVQYENNIDVYSPTSSNELYNNINLKKEFKDTKLPIFESFKDLTQEEKEQGKALKHQEFMSRFMSPYTPYNRMLVFHEVGTGKCVHPSTKVYLKDIDLDEDFSQIKIIDIWNKYYNKSFDLIKTDRYEEWLDISHLNIYTKSFKDGKIIDGKVLRIFKQYVKEMLVNYSTDSGSLKCTLQHKLLSDNNNWKNFEQLKAFDKIKVHINNNIQEKLLDIFHCEKYEGYVFDLEIEEVHNYIANNFITHNTCLLANVSELARQFNKNMGKILVLVRGQTIKKNIIKDISTKCFKSLYDVNKVDAKTGLKLSQEVIDRRRTKNVNKFYQIETFFTFAKKIKSLDEKDIESLFSNKYIFVDEAHRIRDKTKEVKIEKLDIYKELYRFFHVVKNSKIILMSGTPMKDKSTEIVPLLNLLLPENNQINVRTTFNEGTPNESLIPYLKGIVSFVRQEGGELKVIYGGDVAKNMSQIKTLRLYMEEFQSKKYLEDYSKEKKEENVDDEIDDIDEEDVDDEEKEDKKGRSGIYKNSINDSLFVYPIDIDTKLVKSGIYYRLNNELLKYFERNNVTEMLDLLKIHSIKYWFIIKDLLEHNQKSFIFSNVVSRTGTNLLSALLNLFGFEPLIVSGDTNINNFYKTSNPKKRYALLTGDINDSIISKIVDIFKHPLNVDGDYLKVAIGSSKISEGISFYEVRNAYILTPFWNNTETEQAIGRVIRKDSHDRLNIENKTLKIYRLAALPIERKESLSIKNSIDMIMYKKSEDKDINIKKVERLLKQSAIDCVLNKDRNRRITDVNYSKECDYQECDYKCFYVEENIENKPIIYDTYNILYANDVIIKIKDILVNLFLKKSSYDFDELIEYFNKDNEYKSLHVEPILLIRALKDIIYQNIPIKNSLGFINFLREDRNFYFLVDDPRLPSVFTLSYYSANPSLKPTLEFEEYLEILNYDTIKPRIKLLEELTEELYNTKNKDDIESIELNINNIMSSLNINIINTLLKQFFLSSTNTKFKIWFENKYGDYIVKIDKYFIDYYEYYITKDLSKLSFIREKDKDKEHYNKWINVTESKREEEIIELFENFKNNNIEKMMKGNPYGYYGKIGINDKFLLVEVMKEIPLKDDGSINKAKLKRGLACGSGDLQKTDIIFLYLKFGVIAESLNQPLPYPVLNEEQNKLYKKNIKKIEDKDILINIIENDSYWNKLKNDKKFINLVTNFNNNSDIKIDLNLENLTLDNLKRLNILIKYNEVKGPAANLCPGLKKWFGEVGYITRF